MNKNFMPIEMPKYQEDIRIVEKKDNLERTILQTKDYSLQDASRPIIEQQIDNYNACYHLPKNGGEWSGKVGESTWKPNSDVIPGSEKEPSSNPDGKTWEEILNEYGIDGIEFKNGEPDFSPISVGEVKIDEMILERRVNFMKADIAMAEKVNNDKELADKMELTPPITARNIADWRKENQYTWHECKDCQTMQLVPREVHNNIPHSGGISEVKQTEKQSNETRES